jgi:hypothetical protein
MMARKAKPYDAEVEYIESDGSAYIDTGIIGNSKTQFDFSIYAYNTSSGNFFGSRLSGSTGQFFILAKNTSGASDNGINWCYGTKRVRFTGNRIVDINMIVNFNNLDTPNKLTYETYSTTATSQTFNSNNSIYFFGLNNNGAFSAGGNMRLYYLKLYDSSTLVRDYIPVRVGQVGYLYDKVSKTLFGNANSSGSFTFGNDK